MACCWDPFVVYLKPEKPSHVAALIFLETRVPICTSVEYKNCHFGQHSNLGIGAYHILLGVECQWVTFFCILLL